MNSKINVSKIVSDHLKTLRDRDSGKKYSNEDLAYFFGLPFLFSVILLGFKVRLNDTGVAILLSAFSILTGLLLNLLVLIFNLIDGHGNRDAEKATDNATVLDASLRLDLVEETFSNISYSIFLGIVLSALTLLGLSSNVWISIVSSALVFFGGMNLALTLMMILKRIHALLGIDLKRRRGK